MKQLYGTADMEAELFDEREVLEEEATQEYDLVEAAADNFESLGDLSGDDFDGFPALELTMELSDGRILEYELAAVFVHNEKEYVSLHPKTDTDGAFHIMRLLPGENDEITLHPIEGEEELQAVYEAFFKFYTDAE